MSIEDTKKIKKSMDDARAFRASLDSSGVVNIGL